MKHPPSTRALRLFVDVKTDEVRQLLLSFVYFFCLLSSYYVIRPVRETMGTLGGVRDLSWLFTGTFAAMLVAVPLFGVVVARLPRRVFVPLVYHFFLAAILLFAALIHLEVAEARVAQVFFIWTSVFNLFVVSVFWSVMADLYRSEQSKRLYGFIAAGGTIGMLTGSWFTSAHAETLGVAGLLILSAILLECASLAAGRLLAPAPALEMGELRSETQAGTEPSLIGGGIFAGIAKIARSPYLIAICVYILCYTVTATFVYFQQAEIVRSAFPDRAQKTAFFALINLLVGLFTILAQFVVTGRLLRWLPLAALLACLPLLVGGGFVGLAVAPFLWVLVAFQALRRATNFALTRPAREVLFTVVSREDKYKSKSFIDTVVYRGGDLLGGWAFSGLTALGLGLSMIAISAVPIAAFWLAIGVFLGRRQEALERGRTSEFNRNKED